MQCYVSCQIVVLRLFYWCTETPVSVLWPLSSSSQDQKEPECNKELVVNLVALKIQAREKKLCLQIQLLAFGQSQ